MIGIDIIDLADPRTERVNPRFDERVFNPQELAELNQAQDRHRMRWMKWTLKEAAYKAFRDAEVPFVPRDFVTSGPEVVWRGDRRFRASASAVDGECAIAAVGDCWYQLSRRSTADRAADTRKLVTCAVGVEAGLCYDGPVPSLDVGGEMIPVSISHHGRFVAVAFPWSVFQKVG